MAVSWVGLLPGSERDRLINFTRLSYSVVFVFLLPAVVLLDVTSSSA